ncbi:MAG: metal-dependent hydrolase [Candidatus Methanodesulfokora sp.]|jgi:membrane-bound metal-dependent hydrolase YbcI (DUF457 family)
MPRRKKEEKLMEQELLAGCNTNPDRLAHGLFAFLLSQILHLNYFQTAVVIAFALLPDLDITFMHRELLHNLFVPVFVAAAVNLVSPGLFPLVMLGWYSHILLDLLSPSGVSLLFPFSRKRIVFLGLIRSGVPTLMLVGILVGIFYFIQLSGWKFALWMVR